MLLGGVSLRADADKTSYGAGVATANWVHVGLGVLSVVAVTVAYRRDRARLRTFVRRPLTGPGWASILDALLGGPLLVAELAMLATGQTGRVAALERRRSARLAGATGGATGAVPRRPWTASATVRYVLGGAPLSALALAAGVLLLYSPVRAGVQVLAALDPDFTRDAWAAPATSAPPRRTGSTWH